VIPCRSTKTVPSSGARLMKPGNGAPDLSRLA